ncbi:MAG: DUF2339 domain-containing protein [Candidatus Alcyoniella australis]|nr:DUF2339 domain-containing protein [Candidatus Alcyoniella australis]
MTQDHAKLIEELLAKVDRLERRLQQLEQSSAKQTPQQPATPAALPQVARPIGQKPLPPLPQSTKSTPAAAATALRTPKPRQSMEMLIGAKLFLWIGVLAVILAGGFFFALAVQRGWINETLRVIIGICCGVGMLLAAELARARKHDHWGQAISGGGIALLYLSIFASFQLYDLTNVYAAYAFMVLITVAAIVLSVRYDARALAILGLLGGFLTPLMLNTGKDNLYGLFSYVLLLDLAILAIAMFRRWFVLDLLALLCTIFTFTAWLFTHYGFSKLWPALAFLSAFFVLFTLLSFVNNIVSRRRSDALGLIILALAAVWYYATAVGLLWVDHSQWVGLFTVALAVVSLGPALLAIRRVADDRFLINVYLSLAVVFLVIAAPMQLDAQYVTIAWALEGLALSWAGFRLQRPWLRRSAYIIAALVLGRLAIFDSSRWLYPHSDAMHVLFNDRSLAFLVSLVCLGIWARIYNPERLKPAGEMRIVRLALMIFSCIAFLVWGSVEIDSFFEMQTTGLDWTSDYAFDSTQQIKHAMMLSLSGFYIAFGAVLLVLGFSMRNAALRWLALSLLGLTIVKVFVLDLSFLDTIWRVLSFVGLGAVLISVGLIYAVFRKQIEQLVSPEERP